MSRLGWASINLVFYKWNRGGNLSSGKRQTPPNGTYSDCNYKCTLNYKLISCADQSLLVK